MFTLLTIFITVAGAGFAYWFYNRKQIESLSEKIEDKNAVINSFREHLSSSNEEHQTGIPIKSNPEFESIVGARPEKKKKRYNNRQKKSVPVVEPKQQQKQNTEKKNRPKPRKPKTQQ